MIYNRCTAQFTTPLPLAACPHTPLLADNIGLFFRRRFFFCCITDIIILRSNYMRYGYNHILDFLKRLPWYGSTFLLWQLGKGSKSHHHDHAIIITPSLLFTPHRSPVVMYDKTTTFKIIKRSSFDFDKVKTYSSLSSRSQYC